MNKTTVFAVMFSPKTREPNESLVTIFSTDWAAKKFCNNANDRKEEKGHFYVHAIELDEVPVDNTPESEHIVIALKCLNQGLRQPYFYDSCPFTANWMVYSRTLEIPIGFYKDLSAATQCSWEENHYVVFNINASSHQTNFQSN